MKNIYWYWIYVFEEDCRGTSTTTIWKNFMTCEFVCASRDYRVNVNEWWYWKLSWVKIRSIWDLWFHSPSHWLASLLLLIASADFSCKKKVSVDWRLSKLVMWLGTTKEWKQKKINFFNGFIEMLGHDYKLNVFEEVEKKVSEKNISKIEKELRAKVLRSVERQKVQNHQQHN